MRNDIVPNPMSLSPRLSFSKTLGEDRQITFMEGMKKRLERKEYENVWEWTPEKK